VQWYQLQTLEIAYEFISLSREVFPIVNSALKKFALATAAENLLWEKDEQVIVAILATIDSFHKAEVINCRTSHAMWTQLQVDECSNYVRQ
jgi:hypothetical protein